MRMLAIGIGIVVAVAAFGASRLPRADFEDWRRDLEADVPYDQRLALLAIAEDPTVPAEAGIDVVMSAMLLPDVEVRRKANAALVALARRYPVRIATILADADEPEQRRRAALFASHACANEFYRLLLDRLPEADRPEPDWFYRSLVARAPVVLGPLRERLEGGEPEARARAARALAELGMAAEPAISSIVAALDDPDERVRYWSLRSLAAFPRLAPEARRAVHTRLADPSERVHRLAASVLVHQLVFVAQQSDEALARRALKQVRELDTRAVPGLESLFARENETTVLIAARQLLRIDRDRAFVAIVDAIHDTTTSEVRRSLVRLLINAGTDCIPHVVRGLEAGRKGGRANLCRVLGSFGPDAAPAIPVLGGALSDLAPATRHWAAYALGEIGDAALPMLPAIEAMLENEDPERARQAFAARDKLRAIRS